MASIIRIGVARLAPSGAKSLLVAKSDSNSLRTITSKAVRSMDPDRPKKPAPWNYKEKKYGLLNRLFDKTTARFDDNTKVIVVEGPVAAGKTKFAKELAENLDMLYLPEANLDMLYINSYGFDLRQMDEQLPPTCRSFDINNFLVTPKHQNSALLQLKQYYVKFSQYIDALAHVLSTGQGVVLDRCCYSDFVFAEAMCSQGFMSKTALKYYYDTRENTIHELMRPHLLIYLDVPVDKVQQNIKRRNLTCERNSPVLTPQYLCTMEKFYKQSYLKTMSRHCEMLIYDWSDKGEVEIVVEDIERINFEKQDDQDVKLKDWDIGSEEDWAVTRNNYADRKHRILEYFNVPCFHVPELLMDGEESKIYHDVMNSAPGEVYEQGFNKLMGDESLLFKLYGPHRDTLPQRERKLC